MYLAQRLNYSENQATVVFHVFTMLVYSTCLFGAILADSFLGKFKTILYLSILYAIGCGLTAIVAVPPLTRRDEWVVNQLKVEIFTTLVQSFQ